MDAGWLFIILFGGIAVAWLISESAKANKNSEKFESQLAHLKDFKADVKRKLGTHWIAIDDVRGKLLVSPVGSDSPHVFDAGSILSAEIYEDGQTLIKSGRAKASGKAIVNTMVMPGLNLITGGPKAKAYSVEQVKRLELRIVVDGPKPTHNVCLLSTPTRRDGATYKMVDADARFLHAKITGLIQRAAEDRRQELHAVIGDAAQSIVEKAGNPGSVPASVADELAKLLALREAGALTPEEFAAQKARLLRS
jgi:hypothetical protein